MFDFILFIFLNSFISFLIAKEFLPFLYYNTNYAFFEEYSFVLLGIQTTVSILTLTLYNFIIQLKKESYYGYDFGKFLAENISSFGIKFYKSLYFSFILILINSFLIYLGHIYNVIFFVSYIVFIFVILFIIKMSKNLFGFIVKPELIDQKIKKHIIKKFNNFLNENDSIDYLPKIIIEIKSSIINKVNNDKINEAAMETKFLISFLEKEYEPEIKNEILILVSNSIDSFLDNGYLLKSKKLIKLTANSLDLNKVETRIYDDLIFDWFRKLKFKDFDDINNSRPIDLIQFLDDKLSYDKFNNFKLYSFYSYIIIKSETLNFENKINIIEGLFQSIYFYKHKEDNDKKLKIHFNILKTLLDEITVNQIEILGVYLNLLVNTFGENSVSIKKIKIVIAIYIYYIKFWTSNISVSYIEKVNAIIDGIEITDRRNNKFKTIKFLEDFKIHHDIFSYYSEVKSILTKEMRWEKIGNIFYGNATFVKMPRVVIMFYIFYLLHFESIESVQKYNILEKNIDEEDLYIIFKYFNSPEGKLNEKSIKKYKEFLELFKGSDKPKLDKTKKLYDLLIDIYKKKYMKNQMHKTENIQKMVDKFNAKFEKELVNKFKNEEIYKLINCKSIDDTNLTKITLVNMRVPVSMLDDNNDFNSMHNIFISQIKRFLNKSLREENKYNIKLDFRENNYDKLHDIIEKLKEYNINSVLDNGTIYNLISRERIIKDKYDEFLSDCNIINWDLNCNYYLNDNETEICIKNIQITVDDIPEETIINEFDEKGGININDDIFLKMSKEEYIEYRRNNYKNIILSFNYKITVEPDAIFKVEIT